MQLKSEVPIERSFLHSVGFGPFQIQRALHYMYLMSSNGQRDHFVYWIGYRRRLPAAMLLSPLHSRWCLFSCFFLLFSRIPVNGRQFSKCTNRIQQAICFSATMFAWYWNPPVLASPCHPLPMELGELFESFHCGLGGVIEVLLPTSQSA